ncbi:bifunctional diguanylate cyclase/phosphodiesterase [Methylomonas sp. MgM2]
MLICAADKHTGLRPLIILPVLLLSIQIASVFLFPHYALTLVNYVPLHTAMEILAIVVSSLVFAAGWIVYQEEGSANLMLLACCFLGVALLDLMHTLSFPGTSDWLTPNGPEKAINFWLAARAFAAMALFCVAFLPDWPLKKTQSRWLMLTTVLALVGLIAWLVLSHQSWLPRTFIAGSGLTLFKKSAEYLLITIYAAMAFRFYLKTRNPHVLNVAGLCAAATVMAMSEVFFTLYGNVSDNFNFLGHVYKVIANALIYCSVVTNSLMLPYQRLYRSNLALKESEAKFHAIVDESPIAYVLNDEKQRIRYLNPAFINTFGYGLDDLSTWQDWWVKAFPDFEYRQACYENWQRHLQFAQQSGQAFMPMEMDVSNKQGNRRTVQANIAFLGDRLAGHHVVILQDISERVEAMNVIWRQAHLDPLTELPNRSQFFEKLMQEMLTARKNRRRMALLFIDLDRFKDVNDTLGHFMGDILLREAGRRLRLSVGENLTLARLGGDEFTVVVGNLNAREQVEPIAQNILRCLAKPFDLGDETVYISASIGIAFCPDDSDKSEELLKNADQAMYEAKKQGRDRYSFYTKKMQQHAQSRMRLLGELHSALSKQQLMVHYQPIVELATGEICKAEALLRWHHPTLGMVSPIDFIPLAEETGIIVEVGEWVFRTAARQVKAWRERYCSEFQISVNKSPVQFSNDRYDQSHWPQELAQLGLPGHCIVAEITEGLLLDASRPVAQQLLLFRDAGIQVALDDFGTGYSSLAYLKKFDIDYLKIDRSFVNQLTAESNDKVLCEAIIVMAHKLGIKVIAEGIETTEQYHLLVDAGCDYGQGYLFSKPVPAEAFEELLKSDVS